MEVKVVKWSSEGTDSYSCETYNAILMILMLLIF